MANTITNYINEVWSPVTQERLESKLVGKQICRFDIQMPDGDTFHRPYGNDLTVSDYTRNAADIAGGAISTSDVTTTDEYLSVDKAKVAAFFVDALDKKQSHYDVLSEYSPHAAYKLADTIDADVLAEYANAGIQFDNLSIGEGLVDTGITLTTSNVQKVFSGIRKKLGKNNVVDANDFFGVVSHDVYEVVEQYAAANGYRVQDETMLNGFKMRFMGFDLFVSNNLTDASSIEHCVFGKKGAIDLVIQKEPTMTTIENPKNADGSTRLGTEYIAYTMYGKKTFNAGSKQLVDVLIDSSAY